MALPLSPRSVERINEVMARSDFSDVTPEAILAALEAEGIASLEELARSLTEALHSPDGRPERVPVHELFTRRAPDEVQKQSRHGIPTVPFVLDGVVHAPGDISRYDGEELAFFPQLDRGELVVLRDRAMWSPLVQTMHLTSMASANYKVKTETGHAGLATFTGGSESGGEPGGTVIVGGHPPEQPPDWMSLWTDVRLQGSALTLESGESYRDLTEVGWWIFAGDWNDQFSSMHKTSSLCGAFEHVGFTGSYIQLGPTGSHIDDLHSWGWGDRISSVINSG
jgi:hypothetical protein